MSDSEHIVQPEIVRNRSSVELAEQYATGNGRSLTPTFGAPGTESVPLPEGVIITSDPSSEYYRKDMQNLCAVSDVGEVYVSISHKDSGAVRSFLLNLQRRGIITRDYTPRFVPMSFIKTISQHRAAPEGIGAVDQEDTAIRRLFMRYIRNASTMNASDIHFVGDPDDPRIEFRVNKILIRFADEPFDVLMRMMSVAYVASIEHNLPSDNQKDAITASLVRTEQNSKDLPDSVDLIRFAWSPLTNNGRVLVGRLVSNDAGNNRTLEQTGYSQGQLKQLNYLVSLTRGAILFCGTMNSGKSSSLRSFMAKKLDHANYQIAAMSVEDPVEGKMPGVKQIPVSAPSRDTGRAEDRFIPYMKNALRQDVNVFVVGEIRSLEALNIALEACMSGTQLLSTIHANSVIEAFMRMLLMGVDKYFLGNHRVLTGLVAQCLMPGICPHCRITLDDADQRGLIDTALYDRTLEFLGKINLASHMIHQKGTGCSECNFTGRKGLVLAAEVLTTDRVFLEKAVDNSLLYEAESYWLSPETDIHSAHHVRGFTMQAHALAKMIMGLIGPQEVERECGPIMWQDWMAGLFNHQQKPGVLHPDIR